MSGSAWNSGQGVDEARPVDRVAADPDAGALADAQVRELPDPLVGEGARAADDADPARLVDIARHDPDLALAGRDHPRAVRADQPDLRVMRLQVGDGAGHVEDGDPLGDRDDQRDARRRPPPGSRRPRPAAGTKIIVALAPVALTASSQVSKTGTPRAVVAAPAGRHAADEVRAVVAALLRVERPRLAGDPLADQPRVLVDQDAHESFPSRLD